MLVFVNIAWYSFRTMSAHDSEHLDKLYARELPQSSEQKALLCDAPVFEKALHVEMTLMGERVVGEDALHAAWLEYTNIAKELGRDAEQAGITGKMATLRSPAIKVHVMEINHRTGTTTVRPATPDEQIGKSLANSFDPNAFKGAFKGFSVLFELVFEENGNRIFRPVLNYQLDDARFFSPSTSAELYVNAPISTAHLEFEDDIRSDPAELVVNIHSLAPKASKEIEEFQRLLSTDSINEQRMQLIGDIASDILSTVDAVTAPLLEDGICDLVRSYLTTYTPYTLKSVAYSEVNIRQPEQRADYTRTLEEPYKQRTTIRDVVYREDKLERSYPYRDMSIRQLHLVFPDEKGESYIYVPFYRLSGFKKG